MHDWIETTYLLLEKQVYIGISKVIGINNCLVDTLKIWHNVAMKSQLNIEIETFIWCIRIDTGSKFANIS